ncbi:MAG: helix-turn-helix transcriptional regulator [Nitrospirae bacterium]|nr:helix-turn-helix transcriptional regulator [Nitrospirota bacterium]
MEEISHQKGKKITQEELAKRLKISVGFLNMLLKERRSVKIKKLEEIARNAGKPLYWFFNESSAFDKIFEVVGFLSDEDKLKYLEVIENLIKIDKKYYYNERYRKNSLNKKQKHALIIDFNYMKRLKNE